MNLSMADDAAHKQNIGPVFKAYSLDAWAALTTTKPRLQLNFIFYNKSDAPVFTEAQAQQFQPSAMNHLVGYIIFI